MTTILMGFLTVFVLINVLHPTSILIMKQFVDLMADFTTMNANSRKKPVGDNKKSNHNLIDHVRSLKSLLVMETLLSLIT